MALNHTHLSFYLLMLCFCICSIFLKRFYHILQFSILFSICRMESPLLYSKTSCLRRYCPDVYSLSLGLMSSWHSRTSCACSWESRHSFLSPIASLWFCFTTSVCWSTSSRSFLIRCCIDQVILRYTQTHTQRNELFLHFTKFQFWNYLWSITEQVCIYWTSIIGWVQMIQQFKRKKICSIIQL